MLGLSRRTEANVGIVRNCIRVSLNQILWQYIIIYINIAARVEVIKLPYWV